MASSEEIRARIDRGGRSGIFNRIELAVELASDEAVGWRSLGALFLAGGFLAAAAIPLAATGAGRAVLVAVLALTSVTAGTILCRRAASLPASLMSPVLGFGTLLITLVVLASGQPDGRYSLFYVWVALQAFYFLGSRAAALHMVLVAGQYALALVFLGGGPDQWLLVLGTVVTTGWLIGALRARIKRVSTQARTDVLTGLVNRRGFDENIELAFERARRDQKRLSLMVVDLDRFKAVNDRHGHFEGDGVLRRFADLCAATIDPPVARLGGDEFAIIAADRDQRAVMELAERIHETVRRDPELARRNITISVGIATFPAHADSSRSLSQAADRALYHAKNHGRDQVVGYGPKIEQSRWDDADEPSDRSSHLDAVVLLSETLDLRDISTSAHSQTVGRYAKMIAEELGWGPRRKERIRLAGLVHDLGKIGVPDQVLLKSGPLSVDERKLMERHPQIGARILESAGLPDLAGWILDHHERPDGTGYPRRLSGTAVSLEARIVAVADAYEAMTSDRPHRVGMPVQAARDELLHHRGTQFDGTAVDALLCALDHADAAPVEQLLSLS